MKKKSNLYFILGIICYMIAIGSMLLSLKTVAEILEVPTAITTILKVISIFTFIVAIIFITIGIMKYAGSREEIRIADKDERNIMIRGKSSQVTLTIITFALIIALLIFLALEYWIPVFTIALILIINSISIIISSAYYNKKY